MIRLGRWVLRLAATGLGLLALTFVAVLGWTFLWPLDRAISPADAIICLGGGMSADGTLHPPTITRVETCVALWEADLAPVVVFTGGRRVEGGPAAGTQMADLAVSLGLAPDAVIRENRAQSTLHNALFTSEFVTPDQQIILVTEAFHLPRSWASFRWAGYRDIQLAASERVRAAPGTELGTNRPSFAILRRETLALWFNLGRGLSYSIAGLLGVPEADRVVWLH